MLVDQQFDRATVGGRVVHPAQVGAVLHDLLADVVVTGVAGVVGGELHHRAHHVGGRLVQPAGVAGVVEPARRGGDAVRHLVAGHVEGHQWLERGTTIAVGHAEARVVPEGVLVAVAEVHAREGGDAVVADAGAAEGVSCRSPTSALRRSEASTAALCLLEVVPVPQTLSASLNRVPVR